MYILSNRGLRRDEDMLADGPVSKQPHVTDDDEGDDNPCIEVHTLYIHGTYKSISVHMLYIHCTY